MALSYCGEPRGDRERALQESLGGFTLTVVLSWLRYGVHGVAGQFLYRTRAWNPGYSRRGQDDLPQRLVFRAMHAPVVESAPQT